MITKRAAPVAVAALGCLAPAGGLLLLGGCVDEPPSDCSLHLNCTSNEAGSDGGRDADAHATDATLPDTGDAGESREAGQDAGEGGQVHDAAIDAWDGSDGFTCDPTKSPHDAPCVVDEAFGVFVAPAASGGSDTDGGDGSRTRPYATIAYALGRLGEKTRLYVCVGPYAESVALSSAVSLYGGLACPHGDAGSAWSYVGGQAQFTGTQNQVALMVSGLTRPIAIEDISFSAPSASGKDSDGNGMSSIAALVNASTATLRRCALAAGSGDNGNDGTSGSNYSGATAQDGNGNDGGSGGAGAIANCTDGTSSIGGNGGDATQSTATDGGDGTATPMPQTYPNMRLDGLGGSGGFGCTAGDKGAYGTSSDAGAAAAPATRGTLTANGWMPSAGGAGHAGYPGQGGGGGGGLAQVTLPLGSTGGGAGGCGGAGGNGGRGGGASIALACVASSVTLEACTLVTSNGGGGGRGGDGQPGQGGGAPGTPTFVGGCSGGHGGNGAGGSGAAGGTGGISVCVVYQGIPPTGTPLCSGGDGGQPGNGGSGGVGGSNASGVGPSRADGGQGLPGLVAPSLLSQ